MVVLLGLFGTVVLVAFLIIVAFAFGARIEDVGDSSVFC